MDATIDDRERETQEEYAAQLNMSRREARQTASHAGSRGKPESKINSAEALMMILAGVIIDVTSMIPVVGWGIDIFGGLIIWLWQMSRGLDQGRPWFLKWMPGIGTVIGFIPFLPAHTLAILAIIIINSAVGQNLMRRFTPK